MIMMVSDRWISRPLGQITAVVFDLDGTLVDTMACILATYVNTIHSLGGPDVTTEDVLSKFHIGPTRVLLEHFLGRPIAADDLECYFAAYQQAIIGLQPFPGVVDLLDELRRAGYRLGLFTSATRRAATLVLATAGLDRLFEVIVGGDEVVHPKPAPDGLELICRRLGVRPNETAYVGDALVDVECAISAGALAIHARWSGASGVEAGAHVIVERPADILAYLESAKSGRPDETAMVL
jgi:HAD superfamily hydrolase (TIGR01549 family)